MNDQDGWIRTAEKIPDNNRKFYGMDKGGYVHKLIRKDNLLWTDDMEMYVYFVPVAWKYMEEE